jgi:hypothetical protein
VVPLRWRRIVVGLSYGLNLYLCLACLIGLSSVLAGAIAVPCTFALIAALCIVAHD